jgi:division protein CdvB (Snf7/Vps24/ESCRT-III family)/Mn-dependent DtxR family transcriptional regulator
LGKPLITGWLREKFSDPSVPLKEKIVEAKYRIDLQREKLAQTSAKLQQRERELFDRCVKAELSKNTNYANIYANECVEVRKMAKLVLSAEIMLESASLKLETMEEFGDVLVQITPITSIIQQTRGQLVGVIPKVAEELDEVHGLLNSTLPESNDLDVQKVTAESSAEAKKIFEEANIVAEQKFNERFPELPVPVAVPEKRLVAEAEAVPSSQPNVIVTNGEDALVEQTVYEYVKKCSGELNLEKCASDLHISPETVKRILGKLAEEGNVKQTVYEYVKKCSGELDLQKCASDLHISPETVKRILGKLAEEGKVKIQ